MSGLAHRSGGHVSATVVRVLRIRAFGPVVRTYGTAPTATRVRSLPLLPSWLGVVSVALCPQERRGHTAHSRDRPGRHAAQKRNACAHQQSASTVCTSFVRARYVPHELAALMPMWRHITRPTPRNSSPREITEVVIASVATRVLEIAKIAEIVVRGGHGGRRSGRCCKHPRGLTCFRRGREQAATRRRG